MRDALSFLRQYLPIVRDPYSRHSFMRLHTYHKQFTIVCTGMMSSPETKPSVGCHETADEYVVGYRGLIEDAIRLCASRFYDLHAYPHLKATNAFEPRTLEIYYTRDLAYQRGSTLWSTEGLERVLSGSVTESGIAWQRPGATVNDISALEKWIETFHGQVSEHIRADDYDLEHFARREAKALKDFFVSLKWRAHVRKALIDTGALFSTR
ncbi:hypothetical protein HX882_27025 [Pseudomonas gingeri]|uniref:Uncharacterized protein n=1 Tax=Pseudomonas gingeri TaxID=117681 RepID=A0A7Y7XGR3_9PSED|nr:hypothetical protein [Pseudomonas gingeri]NWB99545.1 hypothetical protein [Pseudomonas gingeri]